MNYKSKSVTFALGIAGLALAASVAIAAQASKGQPGPQRGSRAGVESAAPKPSSPSTSAKATVDKQALKPASIRKSVPPLPSVGFAPVRPMDIVRATYDFAAQHPEILKYVPCYCGCGSQGHSANESCFVARRDARGNVLEWDTHGFGCTICVDVAREAMQLYSSGADVVSIRSAIEKKWSPGNAAGRTPTPHPPKK
jgi:hypothetical protein